MNENTSIPSFFSLDYTGRRYLENIHTQFEESELEQMTTPILFLNKSNKFRHLAIYLSSMHWTVLMYKLHLHHTKHLNSINDFLQRKNYDDDNELLLSFFVIFIDKKKKLSLSIEFYMRS